MKTIALLVLAAALAAPAWALTRTGMPALDELRDDVDRNGPLSKKLNFSEDQREKIKDYIDDKSEDLVEKRDDLVAAEKKLEKKDAKKNKDAKEQARETKADAQRDLSREREDVFNGLRNLMNAEQFEGLQKWRAEGKSGKR